jgi:zinc-dependent metalloproteinase lipoprotein
MKKQILICSVSIFMIFCNKTIAQQNQNSNNTPAVKLVSVRQPECATKSPDMKWENAFQRDIAQYQKDLNNNKGVQATYIIPVIVHVLYNASTEATVGTGANIKEGQVQAQIDALNDAFAGNAPGNSTLPTPFANVDANDISIRFCLAVIGENGNTLAEPGIDRIDWKAKGWNNVTTVDGNSIQNYYDGTVKPSTIWDPTKYFNIWIGDFFTTSGGIIGYAKFPASSTLQNNFGGSTGTAQNDGVVMATRCFGCKTKFAAGYYANAFNNAAFSYGITTVHEVGHWLGLHHISGDASCGNDYCADTPPQNGGNAGCANGLNWNCPSYPFQANQCTGNPNGEMFMDFMDYCDDYCRSLFTANQETRMMTAMANTPNRKLLGTNGLCATAPTALYTANQTTICTGSNVNFTDNSANAPTSWKWVFTGGTPSVSTSQNPSVTYTVAGNYNVKLVVKNTQGADSLTKTQYILVNATPVTPIITQNGMLLTSSAASGNQWYKNGTLIPGATGATYTITSNGNYTVIVMIDGCPSNTSANLSVTNTGITETSNEFNLAIFPNPNNGVFNILFNIAEKATYKLELKNVLGQVVYKADLTDVIGAYSKQINISDYGKGIYLMSLTNTRNEAVKKIIVY